MELFSIRIQRTFQLVSTVEIIHVIVKGRNNRVTNFVEIYHKIAPVFILCELFHKSGFTYPSGAFYQKRLSACRLLFPDK